MYVEDSRCEEVDGGEFQMTDLEPLGVITAGRANRQAMPRGPTFRIWIRSFPSIRVRFGGGGPLAPDLCRFRFNQLASTEDRYFFALHRPNCYLTSLSYWEYRTGFIDDG